jgi:hypothetical protein
VRTVSIFRVMTQAVTHLWTSVYFNDTTRRYILEVKVKQSLYTPWRRLGGEEV